MTESLAVKIYRSAMPDSPAVKFYRDTFRLNLKPGFKRDIDVTVLDLDLWKSLLTEWKAKKWNPLSIKEQLSEYERREAKRNDRPANGTDADNRPLESQGYHDAGATRIPERGNGHLSRVREGTGIQFRRSEKTLEEILASALQQTD